MSLELSRYGLPTLLVGIVALVTVLSLVLGEMILLLIFLDLEGVWLVVVGVKMAILSQQRTAT